MSQMNFTNNEVTQFISDVISIGNVFVVEEGPEKRILWADGNAPVMGDYNDEKKQMVVYGTNLADAIIVNPFAEGDPTVASRNWLYQNMNAVISGLFSKVMLHYLELGVKSNENKNKKKEAKPAKPTKGKQPKVETAEEPESTEPASLEELKIISKYVKDIDETLLKEYASMNKSMTDFFSIYYDKTLKVTRVACTLYQSARRKGFSIRSKSWDTLIGLANTILGINTVDEFDYKTRVIGCVVFDGFVHVMVNFLERLQPHLAYTDTPIDVTSIKERMGNIQVYRGKAQWCPQTPMQVTQPFGGNTTQVQAPWDMKPQQQLVAPGTVVQTPAYAMPGSYTTYGNFQVPPVPKINNYVVSNNYQTQGYSYGTNGAPSITGFSS